MSIFLVVSLLDIPALGKRKLVGRLVYSIYPFLFYVFLEKDLAMNERVWRWWKYSH